MNKGVLIALVGLIVMFGALSGLVAGVDKHVANLVHMGGIVLVLAGGLLTDKFER